VATDVPDVVVSPIPSQEGQFDAESTTIQAANLTGNTWYVATTGNDLSNSCATTSAPCATINGAIGKAASGDTILVAIGTYTGSGTEVVLINKNITLSGGWNASFTTQSGFSIIDGQGAGRSVTVNSTVSATIERSIIQNGSTMQGGGIYITIGTLTLNNSIIRNNIATWGGGGGIYIDYSGTIILNNSNFLFTSYPPFLLICIFCEALSFLSIH